MGEMTQSENREDTVGEQNKIEEHDYLGEQESTAGCSSTVSVERSVPRDSGRIQYSTLQYNTLQYSTC